MDIQRLTQKLKNSEAEMKKKIEASQLQDNEKKELTEALCEYTSFVKEYYRYCKMINSENN